MNIFRSLIGKVWHDPNAAEVVKISTGQLHLVRPGNVRSSRECIYNDAMATIRRVPALEHNFQLVITRVYEDGDQELLEDEDETDEERVFLISEELEFRAGQQDGEPTFIWRDLDGDVDETYEFVAQGTNEPTRAFFETCMYRAMYERKYRTNADNLQDADFEEFLWQAPQPKSKGKGKVTPKKATPKKTTHVKQEPSSPSSPRSRSSPQSPPSSQEAPSIPEPELPPAPRRASSSTYALATQPGLVTADAELHEAIDGRYTLVGVFTAKIVADPQHPFKYWLAASSNETALTHEINSDMNAQWARRMLALTWNFRSLERMHSCLLRFPTLAAYEAFRNAFTACIWETLHKVPFSKNKAEDQKYILIASEDVEMDDSEDGEEEEEEVLSELDPRESDSEPEDSEDEEEGEEDEDELPAAFKTGEANSQLTVGYKGNRSFVVRGSSIGVFKHEVDSVKYGGTISNITDTKGNSFKPKHVMLHEQDSKMVMMNADDPNSLYCMDVEVGKVVEEWKVHENVAVSNIAPESRFAQTKPEKTFVGVSHNSLFRIDPRVSGTKLVESQFKQYSGKLGFSGVTTTDSGKLAVANNKGEIRLFDSIGKNAKTALPPLGDPIIGIDVTADGRWIVATTKTYLLLVDTLIGEGKYSGSLGFDRSFPAASKPMPRRLLLRSEHVAYMNNDVSFTPARFNMGEGQEENAIVTSTGEFVVAWDFAKVKRGIDKYDIKKYEDHVVQDNFKFGDDKQIIVALENNVISINKAKLRPPNRASLGGSASLRRGSSSIVNAPY
ncbi:hypothetical protein HGRIS_009549 [Hohenbuehelia grisea]|uniref:VID27 cytoplasmic protein n=1 Tax=Hohenbuehelia grisea TaxID=104357 RepID=A0ABR3J2W4_9AGAR